MDAAVERLLLVARGDAIILDDGVGRYRRGLRGHRHTSCSKYEKSANLQVQIPVMELSPIIKSSRLNA